MGIAQDILRELKVRNWSQNQLARESGMTPQDISGIINKDSNPQINTVIKIADGFGITVDELVCHPKPTPKIRGKPTGAKEVRQCLKDYGLDTRDIKLAMGLITEMAEAQKAKGRGRAATG